MDFLNYNSVLSTTFAMLPSIETLPAMKPAPLLPSQWPTYFKEERGYCADIIDYTLSYIPVGTGDNIQLHRPEACYCRFKPADSQVVFPKNPLRQNWRKAVSDRSQIWEIDLLDQLRRCGYGRTARRRCERSANTKAGDKHLRLCLPPTRF